MRTCKRRQSVLNVSRLIAWAGSHLKAAWDNDYLLRILTSLQCSLKMRRPCFWRP